MGSLNPCTAAHGSPEEKRRKLVQVLWLVLGFVSVGQEAGWLVVDGGAGFWRFVGARQLPMPARKTGVEIRLAPNASWGGDWCRREAGWLQARHSRCCVGGRHPPSGDGGLPRQKRVCSGLGL